MSDHIESRAETDDSLGLTSAEAAVHELRTSVEQRLDNELRAIGERLEAVELRSSRPGATRQAEAETGEPIEVRAFANFCRYGREALSAEEQRALAVGEATGGETLVPDQFMAEIVRNLVQFSPMRQLARVSQASSTNIKLPRRTAALQAGWVAEGAGNTPSEPTYGQHAIEIFEARVHTDVSNALLEDSAFDMGSELARDFAEEFARLEGAAFVGGNGTTQPEGFLTSSDFDTEEAGGAAIDADDLIDLYHAVPSVFAGRGAWIMNRATMAAVRKLKSSTSGEYLWAESLAAGNPPTILGRPVIEVPDMPDVDADAVPLAFGDWSAGYRVFDRTGLTILRDPYSRGANSEVRFLARRRVGGLLVNAEAVKGLAMPSGT